MNPKTRLHKKTLEYLKEIQNFDYTSATVVKNINVYGVYVDNVLVKNRQAWVFPGQEIKLDHWPKRDHGDFSKVKILQESSEFLLIYKPKGVVVESGAGHQRDNLVSWLENERNEKIYLVHRLDKDTQGLLLLAKSESTLNFLQDQFRTHKIVKKYLCIVDNLVEKVWDVASWQTRDKQNMLRQKLFWSESEALKYDDKSRESKSIFFPKFTCTQTNQSLVEVQIKTGRMHQIRLQSEALGFPLSAELVYKKTNSVSEKLLTQVSSPIKSFYPLNPVKDLDKETFLKVKNAIFGDTDYCLISNYLKIETPQGLLLEKEYINVEKLL